MERRRKKADGKHYGFWHQGRHSDEAVLESPHTPMAIDGPELDAQTSIYQPDTLTFPQRRAPRWVALSVLMVAAVVTGLLVIHTLRDSGGTPPTEQPAAVVIMPSKSTAAKPQTARTRTVEVPGPTTTVRVPVPGPTVTVTPRPTPVPGPTVTVTKTIKPKAPKPVRVTVTVTVPGPTVTETVTAEPEPPAAP